VLVRGTEIHLTPKEFDLMSTSRATPTACSRIGASAGQFGASPESTSREYLRVLVAQLRKKIEGSAADRKWRAPVHSERPWVGYRVQSEGRDRVETLDREAPL